MGALGYDEGQGEREVEAQPEHIRAAFEVDWKNVALARMAGFGAWSPASNWVLNLCEGVAELPKMDQTQWAVFAAPKKYLVFQKLHAAMVKIVGPEHPRVDHPKFFVNPVVYVCHCSGAGDSYEEAAAQTWWLGLREKQPIYFPERSRDAAGGSGLLPSVAVRTLDN
jgi:hypothetical protein